MPEHEIAIAIKDIHKDFVLPQHKNTSLKQAAVNIVRKNNVTTQHVLDGVSFNVHKGDFFGIVGRNGSGKSTLLKLIAGVYTPSNGSIEVKGSLTPFIELGVGFNPELSGRDNVYLNGALLGFTRKQTDDMYDEIVEFAELEAFMGQRLKNYSSGMQVRLAFSIAIRAKADILVLDEVLAVGDEAFQRKCNDYFDRIKNDRSQTVILVTHSMEAVKKYCNRAVLIKDGKVVVEGSPVDVANEYTLANTNIRAETTGDERTVQDMGVSDIRLRLLSNDVLDQDGLIKFSVEYRVTKNINTVIAFSITDLDRNVWLLNDNSWKNICKGPGRYKVVYSCNLPQYVNNCVVDIRASIWNDKEEVLGFVHESDVPKVVIGRRGINNKHEEGVATGLLYLSGKWEMIDE